MRQNRTHESPSLAQRYPSVSLRNRHPALSIWLSVDPMADKYPGLSPYAYCANNPVKLVDPDGREWWIDDYRYYPGKECPIEYTESTRNKWETMNRIYATKNGHAVIDEMESSADIYKIISVDIDNGLAGFYLPNKKSSGGTIALNCNDLNLPTLSHEIFHGYQDFYGQGGRSIVNEIEANLFAYSIAKEAGESTKQTNIFAITKGNEWDDCLNSYNKKVKTLYFSPTLNNDAFNYVRDEFHSYSPKNLRGTYNEYPLQQTNQENRLISKFYPL